MNTASEAESWLLDGVRRRDADAWTRLVNRFHGRLVAFAVNRGFKPADAEDFVQDTFLNFLKGVARFRGDSSLETYLFLILRRRMIESLRGRPLRACALADDDQSIPDFAKIDSASQYARNEEDKIAATTALANALTDLIAQMQRDRDFRSLQIVEMLFYAQMRNNYIAKELSLDEKYIALLKHRWIARLRNHITAPSSEADLDSVLTAAWEELRPSCPKRSTIGGYLLKTLDPDWHQYVDFHVSRLGCRFCAANLADLKLETAAKPSAARDRILQSTVGFLHKL